MNVKEVWRRHFSVKAKAERLLERHRQAVEVTSQLSAMTKGVSRGSWRGLKPVGTCKAVGVFRPKSKF